MFACICHAVSEDDVLVAVAEGAQTLEAVGACTGAGTGCGTCHEFIGELIADGCAGCPRLALGVA